MIRIAFLALALSLLAGCGAVSGVAGLAVTAVDVTTSVIGTTVDVVTAPVR